MIKIDFRALLNLAAAQDWFECEHVEIINTESLKMLTALLATAWRLRKMPLATEAATFSAKNEIIHEYKE